MSRGGLDITFRGTAPDSDQARGTGSLFEIADVGSHLLGQIHLVLALLYVGAVDFLHIVVIEDGFAWFDGSEEGLDLVEQLAIENSRLFGSGVHVVFENVPAGED